MMNFLAITWDPSIGIDLGFFTIRWYSLMFVAAFVMGLSLMKKIRMLIKRGEFKAFAEKFVG